MFRQRLASVFAACLFLTFPLAAQAQNEDVYLALGDSYAWGYQNIATNTPNDGLVNGYVAQFAQFLDLQNGNRDLIAFNLALPGESTRSFFSGQPSVLTGTPYPAPNPNGLIDAPFRNQDANTTYAGISAPPNTPQADAFAAVALATEAQGLDVDYVTVQLGGNDILGIVAQPEF